MSVKVLKNLHMMNMKMFFQSNFLRNLIKTMKYKNRIYGKMNPSEDPGIPSEDPGIPSEDPGIPSEDPGIQSEDMNQDNQLL